jgi:anaerobic selenocysteine-containing dehydrogenase
METAVRTVCPRDCYDSCGILVLRRNGSHVVRGDPDHHVSRGRLCRKCTIGYNGAWLDPEARLTRPLRRVGCKGDGRFEPCTWDDAIAEVAGRLAAIVADHGAHTILNTHYTGTIGLLAYAYPQRFFNRLGATEVDPDTVCNKAGHVALDYVYGTSETGFDPRTAADARCVMVWGANPSASAPHMHVDWRPAARAAGATTIVVDPIRTDTAAEADLHLQPFPGSDAALAFALMHVLARDGLHDETFLAEHAVGWDELAPLAEPCTPAWAEGVTGVPAGLVERAARVYGEGPSLLWIGQGLQRQPTGGNVMRAVAALPAVSGNLGRRGAGVLYLNGDYRGIDGDYLVASHLADPPPPVSQMDLAAILEDPTRAQALVCWNINPAASNPDQQRLRRALQREDLFTVALDVFPTDTTDLADMVLPAAGFLEFDDLVAPYFNLTLSAQVKAMEPPGEALPNQEIFRRLAAAMGFEEPELGESDASVLAALLERSGLGVTWDELAERGTIPASPDPIVQFEDGRYPTPSGKVELACGRAEVDGHPRTPLPLADARPAPGRLRLLSPATSWLLNDTFGNDPTIMRRIGEAQVGIHADDAAERGLVSGDRVVMENDTGRLELAVAISDAVPRGVALCHKGRWPRQEPGGANVNVLHEGRKADMGESTAVHGIEVEVRAATSA